MEIHKKDCIPPKVAEILAGITHFEWKVIAGPIDFNPCCCNVDDIDNIILRHSRYNVITLQCYDIKLV